MYYIIFRKDEQAPLLDKSQQVLWCDCDNFGNFAGDGKAHAYIMWQNISRIFSQDGKLYFIHTDSLNNKTTSIIDTH